MADEPANSQADIPAVTTPQAVDPYDIGDTEMDLPRSEPKLPARGPDGKFLPAAPVTTQQAPAAPTPPAPPSHPTYLIRQAEDLGIPAETISGITTEALGNQVWLMNRQREQFRLEQLNARTMADAQVRNLPPTPPEPEPEESIDLGLGEDEALINPKLLEAIQRVGRASKNEIKQLKAELEQAKAREVQRENARASDVLDAAFAKLGPTYEKYFGKGPARALGEPGKPSYMRRIAVLQAAGITNLSQVDRATIFARLKEGADLLYPSEPPPDQPYGELGAPAAPAAPAPNRITPEQWNNGGVARPSHRSAAPEIKGDELAIRNLERRLREAGGDLEDSEIMDGLLPG